MRQIGRDWDVLKRSPVGKIRIQSGPRAHQVVPKTVENDNTSLTHRFSRTLDFGRQYHVLARIYPPRSMNKPHEIRENFKKTHLRNKTQRHSQKLNKKQSEVVAKCSQDRFKMRPGAGDPHGGAGFP